MLIIANWKAYVETKEKAEALFSGTKRFAARAPLEIALAPPHPLLGFLAAKKLGRVALCAQDVSEGTGGAHTGEVTASALASCGATYAIIGHSERRTAGETLEVVSRKLAHALAHDLVPVLCIGERERDTDGQYLSYIREEIHSALAALPQKERARVVIAYEPLWAIGKRAEDAIAASDLAEMTLYIKKILAEYLPGKTSGRTRVLYGGSVEPGNARTLAGASGIDGFLVGHASTDPETFIALMRALA